jgi:RNA polymerase sigma-70 factor (ECF subfamily)
MVDWDEILDREGPAVWRTVRRLLTRRADAEECFQETFVAALELWRRQPVRSPHAVLQRLATARAIDRLRQRYRDAARHEAAPPETVADPSASPAEGAAAAEMAQALRAALADLPGQQPDAFCLHYLEGHSYREVAAVLALSEGAVGLLLHRARARLRVVLAAHDAAAKSEVRP